MGMMGGVKNRREAGWEEGRLGWREAVREREGRWKVRKSGREEGRKEGWVIYSL
jgi:hypothetical protein